MIESIVIGLHGADSLVEQELCRAKQQCMTVRKGKRRQSGEWSVLVGVSWRKDLGRKRQKEGPCEEGNESLYTSICLKQTLTLKWR